MNKRNEVTKIIRRSVGALVVAALAVSTVCGFGGCKKEEPPKQDAISSQTTSTATTVTTTTTTTTATATATTTTVNGTTTATTVNGTTTTTTANSTTTTSAEGGSTTTTATTTTTAPAVTTYTVTFKSYDGTVLHTQTVEKGKSATAPAAPKREHFTFAGWDKAFDNVTTDLVVTATYTTTKTVVYVENATVKKGQNEVTVNVRVLNNPGIMGAVLKLTVDDAMFAFKSAQKTDFPSLTLTAPGTGTTASPYTFLLDAVALSDADKKDGTLFTLTFKVKDITAVGKYGITLSYDNGAIFDENYKDPKVCLENGSITIK